MKTIVILIIIAATPGSCALLMIDEATHVYIEMDSLTACNEQATILNKSTNQLAFCIEVEE